MKLNKTPIALAVIALCTALPVAASVTMQAEGMTRSNYALDGALIKVANWATPGTAAQTFTGASGTYNIQVYVQPETDGQSTLEVYKGATQLQKYTYPLSSAATSFTIKNVALNSGETIKLVGRIVGGAAARVDKIVLTPVAYGTPAPAPVAAPAPVPAPAPAPTPTTSACANPSGGYEGFGRNTTGGAGKPVYRVTNLNDSGAGSLRDALSQANRCVVFDVAGTISLSGNLLVRGGNITIDGLTAPSPGITLRDRTLVVQGASGANNVVLRGIRHRSTPAGEDGIRVYNASNVVLDRVSVSGFGDGAIDITENSRNVTVQWSIIGNGNPLHNFPNLIAYNASRVTVHHNLYFGGAYRNPAVGYNPSATSLAPEIVGDVRNNLIWDYEGYGTSVNFFGTANVVNNYYYTSKGVSAEKTIKVESGAVAHVKGNQSQNGLNLDANSTRSTPYAADFCTTTDAVTAAHQVKAQAGARGTRFGLDATDQGFIGKISIQ